MNSLLRSNVTVVWLVLIAVTAVSWWFGMGPWENQPDHWPTATSLMLVLAFIKVHLVMRYFMEVRTAPVLLKRICDVWVIAVCAAVLAMYWR